MEGLSVLIGFAGFVAAIVWFLAEQFRQQRHNMVNRFKHVYQRILRIEQFLQKKHKFDPSSDLPDIGDEK